MEKNNQIKQLLAEIINPIVSESVSTSLKDGKKSQEKIEKEIIGMKEAAELLGISISTLYSYTSKKLIPHFKPSKKIYLRRSEVIQWIEKRRKKTMDEYDF